MSGATSGGAGTRWLSLAALGWAALAALYLVSVGLRRMSYGLPFVSSWWDVSNPMVMAGVGAALSPLALYAFRLGPGRTARRPHAVLLYLAIGVAYWLLWALALTGLARAGVVRPPGLTLTSAVVLMAYISLAAYALMVMVYETVRALARARAVELEATRLEAQLARVRADALRARLDPDFLFDTFRVAESLMEREPRAARAVLSDLGALLRASLATDGRALVSCQDEVELLRRYIAIRARAGVRVRLEADVEPGAAACRLPPLVLQPLAVELLRRGTADGGGGGGGGGEVRLAVRAESEAGVTRVRLVGTGTGTGTGVGPGRSAHDPGDAALALVRERLGAVYGDRARLTPLRPVAGGVEIEIRVPVEVENEPNEP